VEDYSDRRVRQMEFRKGYNGRQSGDPARLARTLITLSSRDKPPRRFIADADPVETAEKVAATLQQQADAYRELCSFLAWNNA